MKSRITIHTAPNFRPCIRVIEGIDDTQDVKDILVVGFRELLEHRSSTVEVIYQNGSQDYILYPVTDEIGYFENQIYQKYLNDHSSLEKLEKLAKTLNDGIAKMKK